MSLTHAAAGWYPDPWRLASLRYWDGAQWTSHVFTYPSMGAPTGTPGTGFRVLSWATVGLLALSAATLAWGVWLDVQYRSIFVTDRLTVDMMVEADALDAPSALQRVVVFFAVMITAPVFVTWLFQAHRFSTRDSSSAWVVIAWFVPGLNLSSGFKEALEIYRYSAARAGHQGGSLLVIAWWIATAVGSVILAAGSGLWSRVVGTDDSKLADEITGAANTSLTGGILLILAAVLGAWTVIRITQLQYVEAPATPAPGDVSVAVAPEAPPAIASEVTEVPATVTEPVAGPPSYPSEPVTDERRDEYPPPA